MVSIRASKTHSLGFQVILIFELTQQSRDKQLIQSFINYFGCGKYYARANKDVCEFKITKFKYITKKIIPFFKKYPIVGVKAKDFDPPTLIGLIFFNKKKWAQSGWAGLIDAKSLSWWKKKKHLNTAGLKEIKKKLKQVWTLEENN